jgi:hypothetical protein
MILKQSIPLFEQVLASRRNLARESHRVGTLGWPALDGRKIQEDYNYKWLAGKITELGGS